MYLRSDVVADAKQQEANRGDRGVNTKYID